ncbi:MAG TPA: IS110 family transposase [Rhodanobacteraceae bacterium]
MTAPKEITPAATWVAIDIAKRTHAVLVETPDGKQRRFRMANTRDDHQRLVDFLRNRPAPVRVALEATGDYHRTLAYRLLQEGFEVCLVSSIAAARYREAVFNSWDKNDPKDARVILALLKQGITQRFVDPLIAGHHGLQELSKTHYQISLARTRLQHSLLTHYLPLYFPEAERYFHTTQAAWFTRFLLRFPTAVSIQALPFEAFELEAWELVGRKVNKQAWIRGIYDTACSSTGLPVPADDVAIETFRLQLRRYQQLIEQREDLVDTAKRVLHGRPDYEVLCSLPGIGPVLALTILAETGDLRRFAHHRQFLKYCGLDLAKCQSGQYRGQERLSKRGNARLRFAFWFAATVAVRMRENSFREKYERYMQPDPGNADRKRKALTAVAAKMARVAYGLVKHQTPYRCYFETSLPRGSTPLCRAVGTT